MDSEVGVKTNLLVCTPLAIVIGLIGAGLVHLWNGPMSEDDGRKKSLERPAVQVIKQKVAGSSPVIVKEHLTKEGKG